MLGICRIDVAISSTQIVAAMATNYKKKEGSNTMALTQEQITQISAEIDTFGEKTVQYAVSDPELSSHYNRLYRASKLFLKKSATLALNAKTREINEKRRQAKQGGSTSTSGTSQTSQQRTSASSSRAN
jgi:hypothetical protein